MSPSRRRFLQVCGGLATGAMLGLAGCSSSCPDTSPPTPDAVVSFRDGPIGSFGSLPGGEWPSLHGNSGNTGYAPGTLPDSGLAVRWRTAIDLPATDTGGLSTSAPAVAGETVYVADEERVHALSLRTGAVQWTSDVISPTRFDSYQEAAASTVSPTVGPEGTVYVGATEALIALNGDDGTVLWSIDGLKSVAAPVIGNGTVFGLGSRAMVAVDPDGTERWRRDVARPGPPTTPAFGSGTVVFSGDGTIHAFDAESGDDAWSSPMSVETHVAIEDGVVYAGTYEGLHAIDLETGDDRWTFTRGEYRALQSPVITPDTIYAIEQPGEAGAASFALDRTDGEPTARWCSSVGSGTVTAATDSIALVATDLGEGPAARRALLGFSAARGQAHWALAGGSYPRDWLTAPAVLDGAIVLATRGGTVVAIGSDSR
ncbi:MAG: PQQ-binding-like beta-propeller repeat protein [Halanaeroarchaeum sp.]